MSQSRGLRDLPVDPLDAPAALYTVGYLLLLVESLVVFAILHHFWGDLMLSSFSELSGRGYSPAGLGQVLFIFVWAFAVTMIGVVFLNGRAVSDLSRPAQIAKGLWISLNAGIFEEIIYRGTAFLSAMVLVHFTNVITFGFVKWFNVHALLPLADWATFHALHEQLILNPDWVFGAAIVSVTGAFRDEHRYLGTLGWINSWFFGMVMFWLVFNYGLVTAIVAHVLYDALIFTIRGLTSEQWRPAWQFARR